jgi:hypothetical protein
VVVVELVCLPGDDIAPSSSKLALHHPPAPTELARRSGATSFEIFDRIQPRIERWIFVGWPARNCRVRRHDRQPVPGWGGELAGIFTAPLMSG